MEKRRWRVRADERAIKERSKGYKGVVTVGGMGALRHILGVMTLYSGDLASS